MIEYPHRVQVWRRAENDGTVEDALGRDVRGALTLVETVPAWVQSVSAVEQAHLTDAGAVRYDRLIFMAVPAAGLGTGDRLKTLSGAGQPGDEWYDVAVIEDPDGTGHHLEVGAVTTVPVDEVLEAAETVSS